MDTISLVDIWSRLSLTSMEDESAVAADRIATDRTGQFWAFA